MNATARLKAHLPADIAAWLDGCGDDLAKAWRECEHAHWLLHIAAVVEVYGMLQLFFLRPVSATRASSR